MATYKKDLKYEKLSYLNDENIETINSALDNREETVNILKQLTLTHYTEAYLMIIYFFLIIIFSIGFIILIYVIILKNVTIEDMWAPSLFIVVMDSAILVFHFIYLAKNKRLMNYILDSKINIKQNEIFLSCTLFMNIEVFQIGNRSDKNSSSLLNTQYQNLLFDQSCRYVYKRNSNYDIGQFVFNDDYEFIDNDFRSIINEYSNEFNTFNSDNFCKIFLVTLFLILIFGTGISLFIIFVVADKRRENLIPLIMLVLFVGSILMIIIMAPLMNCIFEPFYKKIEEINKRNYDTKGLFISVKTGEYYIFKTNSLSRTSVTEIPGTNDNRQNDNININDLDSASERPLSTFENKISYDEAKKKIGELLKICC